MLTLFPVGKLNLLPLFEKQQIIRFLDLVSWYYQAEANKIINLSN